MIIDIVGEFVAGVYIGHNITPAAKQVNKIVAVVGQDKFEVFEHPEFIANVVEWRLIDDAIFSQK